MSRPRTLIVLVLLAFLAGCASRPPARDPASGIGSGADASQLREFPQSSEVEEPWTGEAEDEAADSSQKEDDSTRTDEGAPPPWSPPVSRTGTMGGGGLQRAAIREYLTSLPISAVVLADTAAARIYLETLVAQMGIADYTGAGRELRIGFSIEEIDSSHNHYARARLEFVLDSGGDRLAPVSRSVLFGRSVFSSVSRYDAGMNSLLGIPAQEIDIARDRLEEELRETALRDGLEYRVNPADSHDPEIRAVLDAVSIAGSREGYRYSFYVPGDLEDILRGILEGSPYRFWMDRGRREIMIVETDTGDR